MCAMVQKLLCNTWQVGTHAPGGGPGALNATDLPPLADAYATVIGGR